MQKKLLTQVEIWAKEKEMNAVHGPIGFTNFDYASLLIEGFDQVGTFATIYNYPYYPLFIERAGYQKDVDWVEYKIKLPGAAGEAGENSSNCAKRTSVLCGKDGNNERHTILFKRHLQANKFCLLRIIWYGCTQ